jgi:hypothetical protein
VIVQVLWYWQYAAVEWRQQQQQQCVVVRATSTTAVVITWVCCKHETAVQCVRSSPPSRVSVVLVCGSGTSEQQLQQQER